MVDISMLSKEKNTLQYFNIQIKYMINHNLIVKYCDFLYL